MTMLARECNAHTCLVTILLRLSSAHGLGRLRDRNKHHSLAGNSALRKLVSAHTSERMNLEYTGYSIAKSDCHAR